MSTSSVRWAKDGLHLTVPRVLCSAAACSQCLETSALFQWPADLENCEILAYVIDTVAPHLEAESGESVLKRQREAANAARKRGEEPDEHCAILICEQLRLLEGGRGRDDETRCPPTLLEPHHITEHALGKIKSTAFLVCYCRCCF